MIDAATHALIRFGLGPRAGQDRPTAPREWLLSQLDGIDPKPFPSLPTTAAALALIKQDRELRKTDVAEAERRKITSIAWRQDAAAQLDAALTSIAPFRERLVWFWANHFTVSSRRGIDATLIGPFLREAIRPHVFGRFSDMVLAVMRHPAMLLYLDNAYSVGPDSAAGQRRHAGLNENLARESLELHTVTPAAGYTQADVTEYARILTGWSVEQNDAPMGFRFRPAAHQPGDKTLMGRHIQDGEEGGVAALLFLATHPATYNALAAKLMRHFAADDPAPAAISRIAARLRQTGGDLRAAAAALVCEPTAWQPLTKLRTPFDYAVAVIRMAGPAAGDAAALLGAMNLLGQPLWSAPLPIGWPDRAADWADPETLLRRADWSYRIAARMTDADPEDVARESLGGLTRPATRLAIARAGSRREALTLLFSSPEFLRR